MAGLGDRDGDNIVHEVEGKEGLDLEIKLWAGVEGSEGGAAELGGKAAVGCVCEAEEVQGVGWDM